MQNLLFNNDKQLNKAIDTILKSALSDGGFSIIPGESFRSDATCWAIIALESFAGYRELTIKASKRLADEQFHDGRVPIQRSVPEAFWPTSLALMAWTLVPGFNKEAQKAANFLLSVSGKHWQRKNNDPIFHDTSLKGWPWVGSTHSWIEPTSLAIMALKLSGHSEHERVIEAIKMILDRQLSSGGWNYGNKMVFDKALLPIPESTGLALSALASSVDRETVNSSIDYLRTESEHVRTPLAVSWLINGLTAWGERPLKAKKMVHESLELQQRYGTYDTTLLSQLIITYVSQGNLLT